EKARVLKFDGEEEGRARVYALHFTAGRVRAARLDVVRPELEARGVRLAVEEVVVVLSDEEPRVVNGVRRFGDEVVVVYDERGRAAKADDCAVALRVQEHYLDGLVRLRPRVVGEEDVERLLRLAGREVEAAPGCRVVAALGGRAARDHVLDRSGHGSIAGARDGNRGVVFKLRGVELRRGEVEEARRGREVARRRRGRTVARVRRTEVKVNRAAVVVGAAAAVAQRRARQGRGGRGAVSALEADGRAVADVVGDARGRGRRAVLERAVRRQKSDLARRAVQIEREGAGQA